MPDSDFFNNALDSLYKAAKTSANFIETALTSKETDFSPADKERLKVALSVLEIAWSYEQKEDLETDEYDNTSY
jgi:hypothetical protein